MRKRIRMSLALLGTISSLTPIIGVISCGKSEVKRVVHKIKEKNDIEKNNDELFEQGHEDNDFYSIDQMNFEVASPVYDFEYKKLSTSKFDKEFYVGFKDDEHSDCFIKWKKYNRGWVVKIKKPNKWDETEVIKSIIANIKTGRDLNTPTTFKFSSKEEEYFTKKSYMGYLFKRYNNEIWKNMYKDFNILKKTFPFMNIEYEHFEKGEWTQDIFTDSKMWSGLADYDQVDDDGYILSNIVNGVDQIREDIIKETSIDVYEVNIDGHIFKMVFDCLLPLPKHLQIKLLTDLLSYKQWSFHMLINQGFTVGYKRTGTGGMAGHTGARMFPWEKFKNIDNIDSANNEDLYHDYKTLYFLTEGIFHEFGHNETITMSKTNEFTKGLGKNPKTWKYIDMFADQDRFTKISNNFKNDFGKSKSLLLKDLYKNWNPDPLFLGLSTSNEGSYHEYAYVDNFEYATELERQFEEVSFFEDSYFFDSKRGFTNSEVVQYTSYFEGYNSPIWDRNSRELTENGKAYRDSFNEQVLGFSHKTTLFKTWVENKETNWKRKNAIAGAVSGKFDFIRINDSNDEDIFYNENITQLGVNHSNWFTLNKLATREIERHNTMRVPFLCTMSDEQSKRWNDRKHYDVNFIKDSNHNGVVDATDEVVSTKRFGSEE